MRSSLCTLPQKKNSKTGWLGIFLATVIISISPSPARSISSEQDCLAKNVYFEARGEPRLDQVAVAHVTVNRAAARSFPRTVCGVVYQPGQFSWTRDSISNVPRETRAWNRSLQIAQEVLSEQEADPTDGAMYFWNPHRVSPPWARRMVTTLRTASHAYARPHRAS